MLLYPSVILRPCLCKSVGILFCLPHTASKLFIYLGMKNFYYDAIHVVNRKLTQCCFTESSSLSERKQVEKKPEPVEKQRTTISALKMNPNIKKEIRPELEKSVEKRLESLGIKPVRNLLRLY